MREWFSEHATLAYICLAMALSYVVQFFVNRGSKMGLAEKFLQSFICALLTAAISVPLLDLFPELPPSVVLLVGSFCGSVGFEGVTGIMHSAERAINGRIGGSAFPHYGSRPEGSLPANRKNHYYRPPRAEGPEPPMPDDMREK